MIVIEHSVIINRPLALVYDYVVDINNAHHWRSATVEAHKTSPALEVGATSKEVLQFMGHTVENTYEVTRYEPHAVFAFKTTSGPIPMDGTYSFEAVPEGTKLNFMIRGELTGLLKFAQSIVETTVQQQIQADHAKLKQVLESEG